MKAYKIELLVVDHDGVGDDIPAYIESVNFPNDCIRPHVMRTQSVEIGPWSDDHPLNQRATMEIEYRRLFQ